MNKTTTKPAARGNRILVRPKPGRRVLDPETGQALPPDGAWVAARHQGHWLRRYRAGSVDFPVPAADTTTEDAA
ncbi:DUF2635 domain-containing protein [Jeongeupia naejangsanensis]|uniref:DUF2635 domain-containing protein n=1 Tax=Jeongeupia naejangsanensis TaxID=613195 RepID=A0ABS2BF90_9NEIS|nr:DUF2635 domain-containing protein [Jeongeupia naejangsanensis]MBM3114277.1 DUF2635 domain-containing protein [Jeongeupia naejangsanensis]